MNLVYYVIFFSWIGLIWKLKKESKATLLVAFSLFIISALLTIFNLRDLAEIIMRVSFIGWIIGISQAVIEYKKTEKNSLK